MIIDTTEQARAESKERQNVPGSIRDIRGWMIEHNRRQSEEFCKAAEQRRRYWTSHTSEFAALKCMDGRLNLSVITETPVGIIQPHRNVGAKFDLGWKYLGMLILNWVKYSIRRERNPVLFAAYHFSKGDSHRGCKGFNYDTDAARGAAAKLVGQVRRTFPIVYPILIGIETDDDAILFHGENGEVFNVSEHLDLNAYEIDKKLEALFPTMLFSVRKDLGELVAGNQHRIKTVRAMNRTPIELNHQEQVLNPGRGADFLHMPNMALIIGPYDPDWRNAVVIGAGIILDNRATGRIASDAGMLLMNTVLAEGDQGTLEWNLAFEMARSIEELALGVLKDQKPEFVNDPHFSMLTAVVDRNTRLMHVLD